MSAKQNLNSHFELVGEFHYIFDHPKRTSLYFKCFNEEPNLVNLRLSLIKEELDEFKYAYQNLDIVEMADAICDLLYVTYGAGHFFGINLDALINSHNINISYPIKTNLIHRNTIFTKKEIIEASIDILEELISNFSYYIKNKDLSSISNVLIHLLKDTYKLGYDLNFNLDLMFREVHKSNLSKACSDEIESKISVNKYLEDKTYETPEYKTKSNYYIIYDKKTGKVLKNYKWKEPNLKQFINV